MRIFGAWHKNDATKPLLQGLQHLEDEYGHFEESGIAALTEGCIQHQQSKSLHHLINGFPLPKPLFGHLGIAYTRFINVKNRRRGYTAELYANQRVAMVYQGVLDSIQSGEELETGYLWDYQTDGDKIFSLLKHYSFQYGLDAKDAMKLTFARFKGYFAIMALFAEEDVLMIASRGCPIAIGIDKNVTYFGSDIKALSCLFQRVIQLEDGNPIMLHSVRK